jgi:DMSO reductase anchor subunit
VVEQSRVRGKYRQLSTFNFQPSTTTASPSQNNFLPDSPNPAITLPTTRYVTNRTLPANLEAADAHEVQPAQAHPPLTFLLVLSQLSVGLVLLGALAGGRSRATAITALVVTLVAVNLGTLHLGQPLKAWRSFLGWRKSWFSRELIAFGIFIGALAVHVFVLNPLTSSFAALTGLVAAGCSAMIYVDTRRPFWNAPMTFGKFFGTTLLLGGLGTFLLTVLWSANLLPQLWVIALATLGAVVKLAAENRIFQFLVDEQSPQLHALNKTALLLTRRFGLVSRVRVVSLVAGGILLLLAFNHAAGVAQLALAATAFTLCLAGELIERHLFFVAEVAPKMPGGGTA